MCVPGSEVEVLEGLLVGEWLIQLTQQAVDEVRVTDVHGDLCEHLLIADTCSLWVTNKENTS